MKLLLTTLFKIFKNFCKIHSCHPQTKAPNITPKMGMKNTNKMCPIKYLLKVSYSLYNTIRSSDLLNRVVKEKSIKDEHCENFTVAALCHPFGSQHQDLWDGRLMSCTNNKFT